MNGPRRLLIGALVVLLTLLIVKALARHRPDRAAIRGRHGDPAASRGALAGRRRRPISRARSRRRRAPPSRSSTRRTSCRSSRSLTEPATDLVGAVAVAAHARRVGPGLSAPRHPVDLAAAGPRVAAVRRVDLRGEHPDRPVRGVRLPVLSARAPRRGSRRRAMSPIRRSPRPLIGGLATVVGAVKVSQPHAWLFVLRHRPGPRSAVRSSLRVDRCRHDPPDRDRSLVRLGRPASPGERHDVGPGRIRDPAVPAARASAIVVAVACLVAVWFVPRERAGAWIGVLSVVGSLSLHIFGLLFLVPAMLLIRREVALLAAIFIATYSYEGAWAGIVICAVGLAVVERAARSARSAGPLDLPSDGAHASRRAGRTLELWRPLGRRNHAADGHARRGAVPARNGQFAGCMSSWDGSQRDTAGGGRAVRATVAPGSRTIRYSVVVPDLRQRESLAALIDRLVAMR